VEIFVHYRYGYKQMHSCGFFKFEFWKKVGDLERVTYQPEKITELSAILSSGYRIDSDLWRKINVEKFKFTLE
jgi:hypothetical protein